MAEVLSLAVCGDCRANLTPYGAVLDESITELGLGTQCAACAHPAMQATSAIKVAPESFAIVKEQNALLKELRNKPLPEPPWPQAEAAGFSPGFTELGVGLPTDEVLDIATEVRRRKLSRADYVRSTAANLVARWAAGSKGTDADDIMIEQAVRVARKLYDAGA